MSGLGLNAQAARRAVKDAGLKHSDIDGLLTAYSFTEPYFMLGSVQCEYLGLQPRFNGSLVVGGATPAVMLKHAAEAIVAGQVVEADAGVAVEVGERGLLARQQGEDPAQHQVFEHIGVVARVEAVSVTEHGPKGNGIAPLRHRVAMSF